VLAPINLQDEWSQRLMQVSCHLLLQRACRMRRLLKRRKRSTYMTVWGWFTRLAELPLGIRQHLPVVPSRACSYANHCKCDAGEVSPAVKRKLQDVQIAETTQQNAAVTCLGGAGPHSLLSCCLAPGSTCQWEHHVLVHIVCMCAAANHCMCAGSKGLLSCRWAPDST
jgi:hypothetical protein